MSKASRLTDYWPSPTGVAAAHEATRVPIRMRSGPTGSAWSLAFQAAAGVGYSILEELVVSFGYRLTGTTEATFKSDNRLAGALGHHLELGIRYGF